MTSVHKTLKADRPAAADDDTVGRGYLDGQMLVAMPVMEDERFARSVIYVCAHSSEGAMGIIVNRPAGSIDFPELLVQLDIRDIIVVVGHRADQVTSAIEQAETGIRIRFVAQNEALGSADALARVRPLITGPVVALLGDYYFRATDAAAVMRRLALGMSAIAVKREPDPRLVAEACAVTIDDGAAMASLFPEFVTAFEHVGASFSDAPA